MVISKRHAPTDVRPRDGGHPGPSAARRDGAGPDRRRQDLGQPGAPARVHLLPARLGDVGARGPEPLDAAGRGRRARALADPAGARCGEAPDAGAHQHGAQERAGQRHRRQRRAHPLERELAERGAAQDDRGRRCPPRHHRRPDRGARAVPRHPPAVARADPGEQLPRRQLRQRLQLRLRQHAVVVVADDAAADGEQPPHGVRAVVRRRRHRRRAAGRDAARPQHPRLGLRRHGAPRAQPRPRRPRAGRPVRRRRPRGRAAHPARRGPGRRVGPRPAGPARRHSRDLRRARPAAVRPAAPDLAGRHHPRLQPAARA